MKRVARIGGLEDQDRWRRDDLRAMSPNRRVRILVEMQNQYTNNAARSLKRVVTIRSNGATAS